MPMSASTRSLQLISAAAVARRRWERRGTASAARSPRGQAPETSAEQRRAGVVAQNVGGVEGAPQLDRARQDIRPLGRADLKVKLRAHDTISHSDDGSTTTGRRHRAHDRYVMPAPDLIGRFCIAA
jgi:hypothetical protein